MPTSDSKLKQIVTAVIEQQPDPYANTYESKEIRTELYKLDKDPTKAKFEAHLRKGFLHANDVVKTNVQDIKRSGIKRRRKSNKITEPFTTVVDGKHRPKIEKTLDKAIKKESKSEMQQLMAMVADMSEQMKQMREEIKGKRINPVVGPETRPSLSKRFSELLEANSFEAYFDLIEKIADLVFGTATRVATDQNAGFVRALKSVGASWFEVTLKAMKDILIKTLTIAKKLNVAALSAVTFNLGGSIEYMSQLVSDAIMLMSAVSWILVNLNILYGLVALVGWVSGSALTPYMGIAIDEFRRFVYSILIDATLLPVRSLWYVLRGVSEKGDFNTLVLKGKGNARLWWFMRYIIDTLSVHVTTFFEEMKASSEALRMSIGLVQNIFGAFQFVFTWITNMMVKAAANAEFVAKQAAKFAAQAAQKAAENLHKVPKLLEAGLNGVKGLLGTVYGKLSGLSAVPMIGSTYDAALVCSALNLSMTELEKRKHHPMVRYALENRAMTKMEAFLVVCELRAGGYPRLKF